MAVLEDKLSAEGGTAVDNDTAIPKVIMLISGNLATGVEVAEEGNGMVACGEAKSMDFKGCKEITMMVEEELRHGKRRHKANMLYSHTFWLNHGDD